MPLHFPLSSAGDSLALMTAQTSIHRTLTLLTPTATAAMAEALAPLLNKGDVLLLSGPIGAGKSYFARSLIRWRMAQVDALEDVPSPTFTLVQSYPLSDGEIWHADLYRLNDPSEIEELGLMEAFEDAICLVEWPDRLPDVPSAALSLDFTPGDSGDSRQLTIRGDAAWATRLAAILENTP